VCSQAQALTAAEINGCGTYVPNMVGALWYSANPATITHATIVCFIVNRKDVTNCAVSF